MLNTELKSRAGFPVVTVKHSQTILTIEIRITILLAITCMIDTFCKNMTATSHNNDRKSTFKSAKIIVKKYKNL